MIFETGDLIVLGILTILLFVFRQFDKNNRSLEKVRAYADKVRAQLDEIVQEKKDAIRDLSIDMEIQEKTDKEILKRVEAARDEMIKHGESIDNFNEKVTVYNERVEELVSMTARVDENLLKIRDESDYVDSVGKRISESLRKIQLLEKAMGALQDEFVKQNKANLDQFQDSLLKSSEERIRTVEEQVEQSELMVKHFRESVDNLDRQHQDLAEEKIALFRKEMDSVRDTYDGYLADVAEKGMRLEADVFDELTNSINTTADRIEDNWKNGINELKESVSGTVESIKERIASAEDGISIVEKDAQEAAERIAESQESNNTRLRALAEEKYHAAVDMVDGFSRSLSEKLDGVRVRMDESFAHTEKLVSDHEGGTAERLEVLTSRFGDHEELMKKEADEVLERCRLLIKEQEEDSSSLVDKMKANMDEVTAFSSRITEQMNSFKEEIDKETDSLAVKLESVSGEMGQRIDGETGALAEKIDTVTGELRQTIDRETGALSERLESITGDMGDKIEEKASELETGLIRSVEEKVGEYEQAVSRRFDRLDGFMEDLDNLENNLKVSLQEAVTSVERDFELFNENLTEERAAFRKSLAEDSDDIRIQMDELEKGLEALKSRAYENVSEKLKVFEDEFFSDLKKRDIAMQNSLEEWQKNIDFRMEEIDLKGRREREEMQQFSTSDMKVKLTELQSQIYGQFDQFKSQVQDFQDSVQNSISGTESEVKSFNLSVRQEIDGLKDSSSAWFEEQFSEFKSGLTERFDKADKAVEIRFDEMMSDFDISRKELISSMESSKTDLTSWQMKLEQQLKTDETALADQMQAFKTDMTENIAVIRDDFRNQREELIVSTNEERTSLRREISENSASLEELSKELERNSMQALDKFKSDYDDFILDFQRKSHDIQSDSELHAREIRQGLSDTREKVDALQTKMFGRIEDDYNLLSNNLKDIEMKQQDFIGQTQIFERADSLKDALTADIESLKEQVAIVEKSSSQAYNIREEFSEILRLNDEIQAKLAKVMSEKQKIDTMDERISRIINLSDSVNLKLDEVSTTHDTLQEYQVRLRQIEDLQDSIDKRFSRLEKKGNVIDTTTEGVDRNFQLMETIEKAVNTVRTDLKPLFDSLNEAKEEHSALKAEQDKVKTVIEKLSGLDRTIADLDQRIESMNKAREWVAGTEARIDSIGKKAREQVQLFGKLMEKEGSSAAKPRRGAAAVGSPDMEVREMVLRLAHEGWKSEEIARTTKLSQGEVELILELSPDFTRK